MTARLLRDGEDNMVLGFTSYGEPWNVPNNGDYDIYLVKIDGDGRYAWKESFGTEYSDFLKRLAIGKDNSIWLTGWTQGEFFGHAKSDSVIHPYEDMFVARLDQKGAILFVRQFTRPLALSFAKMFDPVEIVITDDGALLIYNSGAMVFSSDNHDGIGIASLSLTGEITKNVVYEETTLRVPLSANSATSLTNGMIAAAGITDINDNGEDAFVLILDKDAAVVDKLIVSQSGYMMGEALEYATAIISDENDDLYVALSMSYYDEFNGHFPPSGGRGTGADTDAYVVKYDKKLNMLWSTQVASKGSEGISHLFILDDGSLVAVGDTNGDMAVTGEYTGVPYGFWVDIDRSTGQVENIEMTPTPQTTINAVLIHGGYRYLAGTTYASFEEQYEDRKTTCDRAGCSDLYLRRELHE